MEFRHCDREKGCSGKSISKGNAALLIDHDGSIITVMNNVLEKAKYEWSENRRMNEEQNLWRFVNQWAEEQKCRFEIQCCDSEEIIGGMKPVDMWGWLIKKDEEKDDDKNFGCVVWKEKDGKIELEWKTDF